LFDQEQPKRSKHFTKKGDTIMKSLHIMCAAALLASGGAALADGHDPLKIGLLSTLSGGGAGLGIDVRDGFFLAIAQSGHVVLARGETVWSGQMDTLSDDIKTRHLGV
jgi:hypothetical protein